MISCGSFKVCTHVHPPSQCKCDTLRLVSMQGVPGAARLSRGNWCCTCVHRRSMASGAPLQKRVQPAPWRHSTLIILRSRENSSVLICTACSGKVTAARPAAATWQPCTHL